MSLVYFLKLLEVLEASPELKKTVVGSLKQACWAAGLSTGGGLLGGPPGAFVGAIVGAYMGYFKSDDYQSLIQVIRNMPDVEKYKLQAKVQELIGSKTIEALVDYIREEGNRAILMGVINEFTKSL